MATVEDGQRKNLILVARDHWFDPSDLVEIAEEIQRLADDIDVILVSRNDRDNTIPGLSWDRPTMTVSFGMLGNFNPRRGRVFRNKAISKLDQFSRCLAAGIAMPRTERFKFGAPYDEGPWGEFVVLKPLPLKMSSKGGSAQLLRTARLNALSRSGVSDSHVLAKGPALVQQFVDTGKYPTHWRVLTLFGEALYATMNRSPLERPDLDADDQTIENAIIEPKHPLIKERFATSDRITFFQDEAMFDFARKVYAAFPTIPLQGCDILRDQRDGKLYAIEINAGGNTWHFSSGIFKEVREGLGGRDAFIGQLGAWKIAAKVLIEKTRAFAD
jgi:hypothetical protein